MIRSVANHERAIHLKIKPWQVNRIVEVFIPEVNCQEFSKVVSWLA